MPLVLRARVQPNIPLELCLGMDSSAIFSLYLQLAPAGCFAYSSGKWV